MIEKMKMIHIVTSNSGKERMLQGLRDCGVVHLAEKQGAEREVAERFQNLSRTALALKDYADPKQKGSDNLLSDEEFEKMYAGVQEAMEQKASLTQEISAATTEIDRVSDWGDFSPAQLQGLKDEGFDFRFYRIGEKDLQTLSQKSDVRFVRLKDIDKQHAVALLDPLPADVQATEFPLPEKGLSELKQEIEEARKGIATCDETLKAASVHDASFKAQMLKTQNEVRFSEAKETLAGDDDFAWISGYIPETDLPAFKSMASANGCAYAIDDVADDDEKIPTKVRYNKVSNLVKPVFDILGILPGYREQDISLWFFLFFILFFAMIIGDGAYGALILLGTIALNVKQKKVTNVTFLLYVLSIATIVWGAITGTWFGMESAMEVPLLKSLVIPSLATYPEYFGSTATVSQNAVMKLSFSVGAIQMALGAILSIKKKLAEKDMSWIADAGWAIAIIAMYMLSLNLVIHEDIDLKPVFIMIGIAYLLVVLFGGMAPDRSFSQGLKAGLADFFTAFLNTISCFGNVMSYIRLFAVGMAGVAISQSFNEMAAGMKSGPLLIAAVIVVLIGHALNIVMCFLSVVVHGVRLNVLEFSGQAGLEWTGIPYEPFKKESG